MAMALSALTKAAKENREEKEILRIENARLQKENDYLKDEINEAMEDLAEMERENSEMKKENDEVKKEKKEMEKKIKQLEKEISNKEAALKEWNKCSSSIDKIRQQTRDLGESVSQSSGWDGLVREREREKIVRVKGHQ